MKVIKFINANRPYALTSRLHNNDAMLGGQDLSRCAHMFCWQRRIGAHPLSQCAHPGQLGGVACRGLPSDCMLGDGARGVPRLTPNTTGAPFCDVICIWSMVASMTCTGTETTPNSEFNFYNILFT